MSSYGCSVVQQILSLQRLQFKLDGVTGFALSGINISNKSKLTDFSISDGLKLTQIYGSRSIPVEFILNVATKNPNDGSGGIQRTTATLTSFDWTLYIDDKATISGNIDRQIEIPGTGQTSVIPLRMSLDLYKFFGDKGYDGIINLVLAIGGVNGSAARLKLDARPTVNTPLGPINYPGRITVIDREFRN